MFQLPAGHVALNFVNTLDNRYSPTGASELLASYDDLLAFAEETTTISASQARALRRSPASEKDEALKLSRELRELLFRIFTSVSRGTIPGTSDLSNLNHFLRQSLNQRKLTVQSKQFSWTWENLSETASGPLWPISYEAGRLLVSPDHKLVRECQNGTCRWLFLDKSKNHSRRWCDMKICGNRTKAQRYYKRHLSA